MAITVQVAVCAALRLLILIVTIVVLILIPPAYASGWTAGWMVVLFYTWAGLTIVYCVIATILHIAGSARASNGGTRTSGNMAEVILTCVAIMGWLMMCGTSTSIAQWTIIDTGEVFIWIAAMCLVAIVLLIALSSMFCLEIIQNKVLEDSGIRRQKYSSMGSLGPSRARGASNNSLHSTQAAYNRTYSQGQMV